MEPMTIPLDWQEGHFTLGLLGEAVEGVNVARFPFEVDACHRTLVVDVLYAPDGARLDANEGTGVKVPYELRADVLDAEGAPVSSATTRAPGYSRALGTVAGPATYTLQLVLLRGADVSWQLRVRAFATVQESACRDVVLISEVEANPPGADAGNEWVELHNPGLASVDLSGARLRALGGANPAEHVLPAGTVLAPGARLVIALTEGQFLDNVDETVVLDDALLGEHDRTPLLRDTADDARTNQRDGDAWTFTWGSPAS